MNRREVMVGALSMGVLGGGEVKAATGDFAGGPKVFESAAVPFTALPNGGERRVILKGGLATGEMVRVHESHVPAGSTSPTLHVINHSELVFITEGAVDFVREGVVQKASAGDIVYVAYGTNHFMRNVGAVTAKYKVVAIGGDVKA